MIARWKGYVYAVCMCCSGFALGHCVTLLCQSYIEITFRCWTRDMNVERVVYSWEKRRGVSWLCDAVAFQVFGPPWQNSRYTFLSSISSKWRTFSFHRYMDGNKKYMRIRSSFTYNIHFIVFRNFIEEPTSDMYCRGRMFVYFDKALTFKRPPCARRELCVSMMIIILIRINR